MMEEEDDFQAPEAKSLTAPPLKEIPLPNYPLCAKAQDTYWTHAQHLFDRGKLNSITIQWIEMLAVAETELDRKIKKGGSTRYEREHINRELKKIEGLYVDNLKTSAVEQSESAYAHFGFARRARERRHGSN